MSSESQQMQADNKYVEVVMLDDGAGGLDAEVPFQSGRRIPTWTWFVLVAAVFAASSAGAVLRLFSGYVPPVLRASWRLQATSCVQFPAFVYQLRSASPEVMKKYSTARTLLVMTGSGVALALHFGAWIASLDNTSLLHSLLFVTSHPLLLVAGLIALRRPVSSGEVAGTIVGFVGGAVVLLDMGRHGHDPSGASLFGDAQAFFGAFAVIFYIVAGSDLRSWLPLFLYAFPVTALAAVCLALGSVVLEHTPLLSPPDAEHSLIGWFSLRWFPLVAYLALGPGIVGHTGLNAVLKHLPPLVVSVTLILEPFIGALIGWPLGQSSPPHLLTFLGAPILLGCLWVTIAAHRRATLPAAPRPPSPHIEYLQLRPHPDRQTHLHLTNTPTTTPPPLKLSNPPLPLPPQQHSHPDLRLPDSKTTTGRPPDLS